MRRCYIISKWQDIVDEAMIFLSPQPIVFHKANDVNVTEAAEHHIIDALSWQDKLRVSCSPERAEERRFTLDKQLSH